MKNLRMRFLSLIMSCALFCSSAMVAAAAESVECNDSAYALGSGITVSAPTSVNSTTELTGPFYGTGVAYSGTFTVSKSQYLTLLIKAPVAGRLDIYKENSTDSYLISFPADTSDYKRYTARNAVGNFTKLSPGTYHFTITMPNNNQLWVAQILGTDFTYN